MQRYSFGLTDLTSFEKPAGEFTLDAAKRQTARQADCAPPRARLSRSGDRWSRVSSRSTRQEIWRPLCRCRRCTSGCSNRTRDRRLRLHPLSIRLRLARPRTGGEPRMHIVVFGTGGAGASSARSLRDQANRSLIARGSHLAAIREHGLTIEAPGGDVVIRNAQATDDPAQVKAADVVLLGVKAWQVVQSAEAERPRCSETSLTASQASWSHGTVRLCVSGGRAAWRRLLMT